MTALRVAGKCIPGDYARTFLYLNLVYKPRVALRRLINTFYRMDHVYAVMKEFKRAYKGPFSILEFGVADGYAFAKKAFATRYLDMEDSVVCHGFDSFEGLPATADRRDLGSVAGGDWKAGQYRGSYEELNDYLADRYRNCRLHRGMFDQTLTPAFLATLRTHKPILVWIDCDYYTSARVVLERLIPYLPSGCVIYFDEYEFNFGSRFTGESRLVHEINRGEFGDGIELVLDRELSWDLSRCYRFVSQTAPYAFERKTELRRVVQWRKHTGNDSPLP
ncbi:MAG TPA: class I SAM-dependent methyltransferase [Gammaproteobacteria bacterium]|nr:class I SAM-dependent methyltransferase [Gammaproteobacteria bacterium]